MGLNVRRQKLIAKATNGESVGMEKFLVFAFGAGFSGWLLVIGFHPNALMVALSAGACGYVLLRLTIRRIALNRQESPGFLSRGSDGIPASRVRQTTSVFAYLLSWVLTWGLLGGFLLGCVAFLLAVPPFVIWSLTGQRWAMLWIGLPLSPLALWGTYRLLGDQTSHRLRPPRPSTPTDRGQGDLREYEVRFGWHRAMIFHQVLCWMIVLIGCVALWDAPWVTALCALTFGGYAVSQIAGALMRNVAIRVGPAGVVLSTRPVKGEVRFVPWPEIEAVVVSEVLNGSRRSDRVGVLRRTGQSSAVVAEITEAPPHSIPAYAWNLDMERLAKAIELNAPQVRLVDLRD